MHKKLSTKFTNRKKEIPAIFLIRLYASIFLYIILSFILIVIRIDAELRNIILLLGLIIVIEPFSILYSYFFVRENFREIWFIKIFQFSIFFVIKYAAIVFYKDLYLFCLAIIAEHFFFVLAINFLYFLTGNKLGKMIIDLKYTVHIFKKICLIPFLSFFALVSMRIDTVMITFYKSASESGIYSVSTRIIVVILLFSTLINQLAYPYLAKAINKKNKNIFEIMFKNLVLLTFFMSIAFICFLEFFGIWYLSLFGESYLPSLGSLKILSYSIFISLVINLWQHKKFLENRYMEIVMFQILVIILNIIFNFYLINAYSIAGAAIATIISALVAFFIVALLNPKDLYLIFSSFSVNNFKNSASNIFKLILLKKNPENIENIRK